MSKIYIDCTVSGIDFICDRQKIPAGNELVLVLRARFSEEWANLSRFAVFAAKTDDGDVTGEIFINGIETDISEMFADAHYVEFGFIGADSDGNIVKSTGVKSVYKTKGAYIVNPGVRADAFSIIGRVRRLEEKVENLIENGGTGGGGITNETDPTVPAWAKKPTKPTYEASEVGADPKGTATSEVSKHNTSEKSHNDIRLLIEGLSSRLDAVADSDDTTLDQLSEIVAYIKSNKSLIESITTSKVNVSDIIDNLTTSVSNKPLSAKQGAELKKLIDNIINGSVDYINNAVNSANNATAELNATIAELAQLVPALETFLSTLETATNNANFATEQANNAAGNADTKASWAEAAAKKANNAADDAYDAANGANTIARNIAERVANGEFDGKDGTRGTGILNITGGLAAYTTAVNGLTPAYRILLSRVKTDSKVNDVLVGDTIRYSTFIYPIIYVDDTYAYCSARTSIQGSAGTSVTVKSVSESTESGGSNVVTFSDGKTLTVMNGKDGTGGDSVPDYVKAESREVARKVIEKQTINSLVLLMGADIHVSTSETVRTAIEHMGMGVNEIKKYITPDCVAYLGDYNYGVSPTSLEQGIECMMLAKKYLEGDIWMNGNHDYYAVSPSDPDIFTDDMAYAFVGSHNTDKAVVDVDNLGRNYGYVDYEKQRIRLIYLNTTDIVGTTYTSHLISTVQGQWLVNTALNLSDKADEEKWGVVVLTHIPAFENPQLPTVLGNFKDKASGSNFGVSYDFSTAKADLIATFHGHIHNFKVTDMTTTAGNVIKAICIPNAVPGRENPYTGNLQEVDSNGNPVSYPKTAGTAEETSFNAVVIDKDNKKIHAICYGAGYDREILYTEAGVTPSPEPDEEVINQIPISTDASGAVYNGTGYKDGIRLGSDGKDRTGAPTDATGFIPCVKGDILYLKNCQILNDGNTGDVYQFLGCYKSDKSFIRNVNLATATFVTKDENNFVTSIDTSSFGEQYDNMAFVRICGNYIGADSIITVNQPIE